MKTCPVCKKSYSDDAVNFCFADGAALISSRATAPFSVNTNDVPETQIFTQISGAPNSYSSPESKATIAASFPPVAPNLPPAASAAAAGNNAKRSYKYVFIAVGAVICVVFGGLIILAGLIAWSVSGDLTPTQPETGSSRSNAKRPTNSAIASANNFVSPQTNQASAPQIDLTGVWKGEMEGSGFLTVNITNQTGETFSGTLNEKNLIVVEFVGKIDFEKRSISMKDTKIIKGKNQWNLGSYDGTLSENGKTMSGKGRDKRVAYSWTFAKQ